LIGLFDSYFARATPWEGAQRLADLGFDAGPELRTDTGEQSLELPTAAQLDYAETTAQSKPAKEAPARSEVPAKTRKQTPADHRGRAAQRAATSGYAPGDDPGTRAAQDVQSGRAESIRKAAQQHGVSEGTVRNRIKELKGDGAQISTPIPEPALPVVAGVNGHTYKPEEN